MEQIINSVLVPGITSVITAFVTWFFARRKQEAEVVQSELDAVEKAIAIWRDTAESLKKKVDEQSALLHKLQEEVATLRRDNARLLSELKQIKKVQNQQINDSTS